jgi:hypothetical protein
MWQGGEEYNVIYVFYVAIGENRKKIDKNWDIFFRKKICESNTLIYY